MDEKTILLFVDESGEGNRKVLQRAFEYKVNKSEFSQRNDLYLLNGVAMNGKDYYYLQRRFSRLKKQITKNGMFDYEKKGQRPIVFRNHNLASKTPPFDHLNAGFYEELNKTISFTNYKQIASGLNYYCFTQNHEYDEKSSPLLMALGIVLVQYASYLNSINKKGIIIFEEETQKHDTLKLKYIKKVLHYGNKTNKAEFFKNIKAVYFRKKWTEEEQDVFVTTSGLELADLTLSPLRRIMNPEFLLIERKFYGYPYYVNNGFTSIN